MRFLSLVWALALLGCVAVGPTAAPEFSAPHDPCETVMQTYCMKGDACGAWPYEPCAAVMVSACSDLVGISSSEANLCSEALVMLPCGASSLPPACFGI